MGASPAASKTDGALSRLELAACLTLGVIGVYATSFGPAMPVLAEDFGVSLDTAGILLTVLFVGGVLASGSVAARLHRADPRVFTAAGLGMLAAGMAGFGLAPSWEVALPSAAVGGFGGGLMDAGAHTIVTRVSADVARGVNRLNVCFAAGAIAGPLWSGGVLAADAEARPVVYLVIAALALGVAAVVATSRLPAEHAASPQAEETFFAGMTPLVWAMGLVLFLYVGAEFGLGSWVATYADEEFEAGIFLGGVITAGYWGALMAGRLVSGWLFGRGVPAGTVLIGSIAAGTATSAAIAAANESFVLASVAAFATGLAFGPIWPAAMAIAASGRASAAPAAMVTIGNSGGFVFPWLQGRLLVSEGATTGIALSAVLCLAMLAVAWRAGRPAQT